MGKLLFLIDGFVVIIILSDFAEFSLLFSIFYFIELTLNNLCSLDTVTQLFNLIIPSVMDSPVIQKGFEMKAIYSEKPPCIQNHPMYILAKHLRQDKRTLDFHKCIFDINHRKLLYNEYHIKEPLT